MLKLEVALPLYSHALHVKYLSIQMLSLITLQRSGLKSSFRGPRVCLADCDPLSTFPGVTLVCTDVTESRIGPDLQQSKSKALITVPLCIMCADRNLAGAAVWFQCVPEGRI